jgi:hypothetical protein
VLGRWAAWWPSGSCIHCPGVLQVPTVGWPESYYSWRLDICTNPSLNITAQEKEWPVPRRIASSHCSVRWWPLPSRGGWKFLAQGGAWSEDHALDTNPAHKSGYKLCREPMSYSRANQQGSTGAPAKIGTPGPGPAPAKILEIWPGISSSNLSNSFYYCLIIVKIQINEYIIM